MLLRIIIMYKLSLLAHRIAKFALFVRKFIF